MRSTNGGWIGDIPQEKLCLASSAALGMRIQAKLARWAVQYVGVAKMLGVGVTAGTRRNMRVTAQRIKKLAGRSDNYAKLKRLGMDTGRILRTGGVSTMTYGLQVHGVSDYMLLQMRRVAAGLCGSMARGSHHNLELIIADNGRNRKADPAFDAHQLPIGAWAEACWQGWMHYTTLEGMVQGARRALLRARRPWAVVKGPAAAMMATAQRLGWHIRDALHAVTDAGVELCFDKDSPTMVVRHVEESVVRWRWRSAATNVTGLGRAGCGGAEWAPVESLMGSGKWSALGCDGRTDAHGWYGPDWRGRPTLTVAERGALRSAVAGRQWPQQRLHQAGLAGDPLCKLCQACGKEATGTLAHRLIDCPIVANAASANCPTALRQAWQAQHGCGTPQEEDGGVPEGSSWWQRAIFPMVGWPRLKRQATFEWVVAPAEPLQGVTFYVDGSMLDGSDPRVAAVGWAVVAVKDSVVVAIARGRAPHHITNIQSAEIWALAIATELASAARSYTDCEAVAAVAKRGYRYATSSKQLYARAWKEVFDHTERRVPDVVWMPAHKGKEAVGKLLIGDGSLLTEEQRFCNELADKHAKIAAATDRVPRDIRRNIDRVQGQAAAVADWIARATHAANHSGGGPQRDSTGEKPTGSGRRGGVAGGRAEGRGAVQSRPIQQGGHSLAYDKGLWRCSVCRRSSENWHRIAPGVCRGAAEWHWAQRAEQMAHRHQVDGAGHRRAAYGGLTWCLRCGSYAVAWAKGLAMPCKGAPGNPSQQRVKARLMAGRHPRTNRCLHMPLQLEVAAELVPSEHQTQEHHSGIPRPMRTQVPRRTAGYLRLPGGDAAAFSSTVGEHGK